MTPARKRDLAEQAQHLCAGLETCPEALQPSPSGHTREQLHRLLDRAIDQLRGEHEFPKRWPKARSEKLARVRHQLDHDRLTLELRLARALKGERT